MENYTDDLRFLCSTPKNLYVPTLFSAGKELGRRTNVKLKEREMNVVTFQHGMAW